MAKRYVDFNVYELQKVAAQATKSESCIEVEKLPEGLNGKVFLLTMDDGAQVVAKLPNPCGGRPHFTTASEVATMDYVSLLALSRGLASTDLKGAQRTRRARTQSVCMVLSRATFPGEGRVHHHGESEGRSAAVSI
jgi:hypothetical protein